MGKSISYCYKCSSLLREDDFARGKAFQDGNRVVCANCAPGLRDSSTRVAAKSSTKISRGATSTRLPAVKTPLAFPVPEGFKRPDRSRLPLILGAAGGGLALLAVIVFFALKEGPTPAPIAPSPVPVVLSPPVEPPPQKEPEKVVRAPDQLLLESARKYAAERPDDLDGQKDRFEKIIWDFERTASAVEAKKEIDAIRAKIAEKVTDAMTKLEEEIKDSLAREAFGPAIKEVNEAAKRLALTEWPLAVSKRSREISEQARLRCDELCRQAEALVSQGKAADAQALVARVRGWQIQKLVEKIEEAAGTAAAAKTEDPPKTGLPVEQRPRSEEGKSYLARWQQAMVRVAARDYEAAIGDLQAAVAGIKEADVAAEAKADLEDIKRLQALVKETIGEAVAKPRAWMSVELRDGRKASGRVVWIDSDRVELAGKPLAFAEWSEMTAASIAALPRTQKAEARVLALFCLAEGELEPAKAILGASLEAVPAKYWAWAPEAKSKIPKAEPIELAAREQFYSAERDYISMATRGLAVEKYKSLRKDYAASTLVRRLADRIDRRTEACKEYYFGAAEFERAGTLKLTKAGRLESDADSDGNFANTNWGEIEFYALPGTTYRAWVQAGGCCQEAFAFLWQGTDLTEISPSTRKPGSADVGAKLAAVAKISIKGLKAKHDPKTPKAATRWEWVELPLPKYAEPGPKRIRIMTDQKGFGIAALVVSTARKAPPKEDEVKELEKARAAEAPPLRLDPDLVAWYLLDEGSGSAVADLAGGHAGTVNGAPKWINGKLGGALALDGQSHVVVPDAEDLRITGDITIAFWMRKDAEGADWQRLVGKGDLNDRTYGVWCYKGEEKRLLWQQYDKGDCVLQLFSVSPLETGRWIHVACTVQGNRAAVYMDGKKESDGVRARPSSASNHPLTLGHAGIHSGFPGGLDDVRIYKRALSADEVRDLFEMGK